MKKYFYLGIIIILMVAGMIVVYGAYLNYNDEKQIASRMESRVVRVTGAKVQVRPIWPRLEMDTVQFYSQNMTDAVALVSGWLTKWHVEKNSPVHKGDVILSMDSEQIPIKMQQAATNVRRAEANLAKTQGSFQRQEQLMGYHATSLERYEEAKALYLAAQEELQSAKAEEELYGVQASWLQVTSPVDGDVLIIYQREGAHVESGTPVALIGDFNHLRFNMTLGDVDAKYMELGSQGLLRFADNGTWQKIYDTGYAAGNRGRRQEIRATLVEITPPLSEPADIRRAVWEVDNRSRLLEPMTYMGLILISEKSYDCLTVPLKAMVDADFNKVMVVDGEGIIHLRKVAVGISDEGFVEIIDGLQEGEVVLTGKLEGLKDGMRVDVSVGDE